MSILTTSAFAFFMILLSYVGGRLSGQSDAKKKAILHNGIRFVYRAAPVVLVIAFVCWRTSFPWWQGVVLAVGCGAAMSIGVRWGFNLGRTPPLNRHYLGVTSWDDRLFVRAFTGEIFTPGEHSSVYQAETDAQIGDEWIWGPAYRECVHHAGIIRTWVESLITLASAATILFA